MWQFLKRSPVTSAIVGAVLLIALVAIVYAVLTKAGDDGFKRVNGNVLRWDKRDLPLVCFHKEDVPNDYLDLYATVAHTINDIVGEMLLRPCMPWMADKDMPKMPSQGLVYLQKGISDIEADGVSVEDESDPETGGRTILYFDMRTGILRGVVVQIGDNVGDKKTEVMLHELGHVLGLDHDRTRESIMYANVSGRPGGLTQKDAKLLKKAYGNVVRP